MAPEGPNDVNPGRESGVPWASYKTTPEGWHDCRMCRIALGIILLAAAIAAFWHMAAWGSTWRDEEYQAYYVIHWDEARLAPLSYAIGRLWLTLTGETVLNLRILVRIIAMLAVSAGALYAWRRTRSGLTALFIGAVCAWVWRYDSFMLYNWDSASLLWYALGMIASAEYFRSPSFGRACACGLSFALMCLARLPSGAVLPLFICVAVAAGAHDRAQRKALTGRMLACLAVFAAAVWLGLTLIYGSLGDFLGGLGSGTVSGHSIEDLGRLKWRIISLSKQLAVRNFIPLACISAALLLRRPLCRVVAGRASAAQRRTTCAVALLAAALPAAWAFLLAKADTEGSSAECMLGGCACVVIAFLLLPAARGFVEGERKSDRTTAFQLWGCACVVVAMCAGSDAFIERIEGGCALPVIASILMARSSAGVRMYLKTALALLGIGCAVVVATHWTMAREECRYAAGPSPAVYSGLVTADDIEGGYALWQPAVEKLQAGGERYLMVTPQRFKWILALGHDAGPEIHNFHFCSDAIADDAYSREALPGDLTAVACAAEEFESMEGVRRSMEWFRERGFDCERRIGDVMIFRQRK